MSSQTLPSETTLRLLSMMETGAPLPPKLVEHNERIEELSRTISQHYSAGELVNPQYLATVERMHHERDMLYIDWANGVERVRWVDMPTHPSLTPEMVVRECVDSTESFYGARGVEVLAAHLDACGHDHLLLRLGLHCVKHVREYFDASVSLPRDNREMLDSLLYLTCISDAQSMRNALMAHLRPHLHTHTPKPARRALVANIEWGIGNIITGITETGFAYGEASIEEFGLLLQLKNPDAYQVLWEWELWKAAQLIELLKR